MSVYEHRGLDVVEPERERPSSLLEQDETRVGQSLAYDEQLARELGLEPAGETSEDELDDDFDDDDEDDEWDI